MCKRVQKILVLFLVFAVFSCDTAFAKHQLIWRKLAFKEEFNKPAGAPVDTSKWTAEIGGGGWGNQELEYYTNSTENAYHDGTGLLVIKAVKLTPPLSLTCWYGPCQYTSARLITKQKFDRKYGRVEARIKIPRSQGMWPAFWLLGSDIDKVGWPNCGEIDVMENIGREPSIVHGTVHGPGYSGAKGIGVAYNLPNNPVLADGFHVYAVEWRENKIQWYIDGHLYHTVTPQNLPKGTQWVFNKPFFIILNLAVGGPWGGNPDDTSIFPGVMMIDYVRVHFR